MDSARRSWKLQEFVGHKANVNCLAMGHKSNQVLATGGDDKKVNLWAIGRQSCLMSLSGHTTPVECVCFGHSEDLVCAGSQTGALKIWDLEAVKLLRTFSGHKGAIKCMDFHPYGDYLTTGSCDSNIKLWDTRKRDCIVTYSSHRLAVNSIQFSPDGQWIASACDDGLVKVWDVRIGKVLKEFEEHDGAVSCVKFHPHEFLLASCAADGTVNFWDMEKFQLVSKYQKPHAPIRHMLFSADGNALLCACSEGLIVLGWEPVRELDVVAATWGHVQDLTMAHTQLIAGSFHSTYIQLSVVDMNKVHPFGGPPPPTASREPPSPFQKGQSVRKSFSKEKPAREGVNPLAVYPKAVLTVPRELLKAQTSTVFDINYTFSFVQVIHRPTKLDDKTVEESTSSTENDDDSALIPTCSDYKGVFKPSRALTRTPPPPDATSEDDYSISGTSTCKLESTGTSLRELLSEDRPPLAPPSPPQRQRPHTTRDYAAVPKHADTCTRVSDNKEQASSPARDLRVPITPPPSLNRHNSYKETKSTTNLTNNLRPSNSDMNLAPPSLGQRSVSFTRANSETSRRPEPRREVVARNDSPDTEFVPFAADRPVGLDLDEFLPRSRGPGSCGRGGAASEQEVLGAVMRGHDAMMTVLVGRQRALQIFHSVRVNKSLKIALESVIALEDMSVILDILNVMAHKPSIWNLDICLLMLPKIHELLQSKYESYMQCGCNALRLIMRNFSSVVRANVSAPRGQGVDIPREERSAKCSRIHQMLLETRAFLLKRQTMQGRLGAAFRDLHALMQQGLD